MTYFVPHRFGIALFMTASIAVSIALNATRAQQQRVQNEALLQDSEKETDVEESRRMFRTFGKQRVVDSGKAKTTPRNTAHKANNSASQEDAFIGFTVWEMRESSGGTERRSFVLKKSNGQNVVLRPFRLGADSQLVAGRSYVFSIEAARAGYLYVIDREVYKDGSLGAAMLLFPTKDARGGNNLIAAGYPVEIPDQKTESAYFEATRNGQNHIGEALTIIVSAEPLVSSSSLKADPITLEKSEVEKWERQWATTRARWADNPDSVGRAYSEAEGRAGGDPAYKLKETDPLPQRLYRVGTGARNPLIVTLQLRYAG
jgi:hypothetical protein